MSIYSCPECEARVAHRDHDPDLKTCPLCATEMETDA